MKKSVIIITTIASLIILILFLSILKNIHEEATNSTEITEYYNEPACEGVEFSEYFVDPAYVEKVGQIGVVHGSGMFTVGRSYVSLKNDLGIEKVPIYAPTDMILMSGAYYQNPGAAESSLPDYALNFNAGCGVEITFAHLKVVVDSIGFQLPEVSYTGSQTNQLDSIEFEAGELIGYYIQNAGVAGFDFMVHDKNVVNEFANQARQEFGYGTNLLHAVCPYDFYVGEKRESYYNLIGGAGGMLFEVKECGPISRDFSGTISGLWFLEEEVVRSLYDFYKEEEHPSVLSIIGDEERITIGGFGDNGKSWIYQNNPTYKLPKEVVDEYCYEFDGGNPDERSGWVYLKLVDEKTMDIIYSEDGNCPGGFFSDGKRYYR